MRGPPATVRRTRVAAPPSSTCAGPPPSSACAAGSSLTSVAPVRRSRAWTASTGCVGRHARLVGGRQRWGAVPAIGASILVCSQFQRSTKSRLLMQHSNHDGGAPDAAEKNKTMREA
ncbi:hypothetical protein SEVIR_9G502401v4 [Setaria viridis]